MCSHIISLQTQFIGNHNSLRIVHTEVQLMDLLLERSIHFNSQLKYVSHSQFIENIHSEM